LYNEIQIPTLISSVRIRRWMGRRSTSDKSMKRWRQSTEQQEIYIRCRADAHLSCRIIGLMHIFWLSEDFIRCALHLLKLRQNFLEVKMATDIHRQGLLFNFCRVQVTGESAFMRQLFCSRNVSCSTRSGALSQDHSFCRICSVPPAVPRKVERYRVMRSKLLHIRQATTLR